MSYESDYLKSKRWYQLATFGYYTEKQLKQVSNALSLLQILHRERKLNFFNIILSLRFAARKRNKPYYGKQRPV
jgi:hypothetical protein